MHSSSSAVLISAFLCLAISGCGRDGDAAQAGSGPQAMPVPVQNVKLERVSDFSEYLCTIKSRGATILQPQVEGQITRIFVASGDRVQAGASLIQIDPLKQEATVRTEEANRQAREVDVELRRVDLERRRRLAAEGVISKQELDEAVANYEAAKAALDASQATIAEQREQLRYYTVKAPKSGVVGDIPVRVGDRVTTATELTTVDSGGDLEAYVSVPAERASDIKRGAVIELLPDAADEPVRTRVNFVSPRIDPASQLLLIKAEIPPGHRFRNDQLVRARVIWRDFDAPLLPITAVQRMAGQIFAFVAESDGKQTVARQRSLKVGDLRGGSYIVLEGIKPGDKLIVGNTQMLADGAPVAPMEEQEQPKPSPANK